MTLSRISALHLAIKVPYFCNSWDKNEKVTALTVVFESLKGPIAAQSLTHALRSLKDDTFSISALPLAIKIPYFSNSGHKNEKVTPLTEYSGSEMRLLSSQVVAEIRARRWR
eukprot:SAG31_NODE_4636_length_3080_cov_2.158672_3_plen_112_part_00